jgi:hypothetical protein
VTKASLQCYAQFVTSFARVSATPPQHSEQRLPPNLLWNDSGRPTSYRINLLWETSCGKTYGQTSYGRAICGETVRGIIRYMINA